MTLRQGLSYVLRHAWLWPLRFWLRPLDVIDDAKQENREGLELACAVTGGAVWGLVAGVVLWTWTGDLHNLWVLPIVFAVAVAVALAGAGAVAGIAMSVWKPAGYVDFFVVAVAITVFVFGAWAALSKFNIDLPDWALSTFFVSWLILLPMAVFALFPRLEIFQAHTWGVTLAMALPFGIVAGFFNEASEGLWTAAQNRNLHHVAASQVSWLTVFWGLLPTLALIAWFPDPETPGLDEKLNILALYLVLTAPILTGLPLYPLLALAILWQYRKSKVRTHTPERFNRSVPFRWQTFAYPLPGLPAYLKGLVHEKGSQTALEAIQTIQYRTLQRGTVRRAVRELSSTRDTALPFCGQVAVDTNAITLLHISRTGSAAHAVTALARKQEKEERQPLRLYVSEYAPKPSRFSFRRNIQELDWLDKFESIRANALQERLVYAQQELKKCAAYAQFPEFQEWLAALASYLEPTGIQGLHELPRTSDKLSTEKSWLQGGWQVLARTGALFSELDEYRKLTTADARRELLTHKAAKLQSLQWDDLPEYWGNIGKELATHWVELLQEEAKQAREWLRLGIKLVNPSLTTGEQTLQLQVRNPTAVLARKLRVQVDGTAGLEWHHPEANQGVLEGGQDTLMRLELRTQEPGRYRITGTLVAEDLSENPFSLPFAFQLTIAEAGRPYQVLDYQPFVVGEGLPDDRTFVGRTELLHWLRNLWRQPQGKPTVALVGQRRIGKTSLLNKIIRAGLPDTNLLPVKIDIQGVNSDYDFLTETARKMAQALEMELSPSTLRNPMPVSRDFY
jgi:hypothetical protein